MQYINQKQQIFLFLQKDNVAFVISPQYRPILWAGWVLSDAGSGPWGLYLKGLFQTECQMKMSSGQCELEASRARWLQNKDDLAPKNRIRATF